MKSRKILCVLLSTMIVMTALASMAVFAESIVTLYSSDGRTIGVNESLVPSYQARGWTTNRDEIFITMYDPDGIPAEVLTSNYELYLAAGWGRTRNDVYCTIYAPDGRSVEILKKNLAAYLAVGWSDVPFVTIYATDGRTAVIRQDELVAYQAVGWLSRQDVFATIYAPDGKTAEILKTELPAYLAVGWSDVPFVTIYAPDGRTAPVPETAVSAYLAVGWYANRSDVYTTIYSLDGKTAEVLKQNVPSYLKIGWYQEPIITMYGANGKTAFVLQSQIASYEQQGWSRNSVITYDDSKTGSVTGLITWQYNKYVGTKPDVDAKVYLIQANHKPTADDKATIIRASSSDPAILFTRVDGNGNFYFDNIPCGEYYILVISRNVTEAPSYSEDNISITHDFLDGVIADDALEWIERELKLRASSIKRITVKENQTVRFSKDWGYTYI